MVPCRPFDPLGRPAVVLVLVADSGQPVRCRRSGTSVAGVIARFFAGRQNSDLGDLQFRALGALAIGAGHSPAPTPRPLRLPHRLDRPSRPRRRRARPDLSGRPVLRRPLRRAPDRRGLVFLEDPKPDLLDLVSQRRRALELEVSGGLAHLRFHLPDELLHLPLRHLGEGSLLTRRRGIRSVGLGHGA